MNILFIGLGSIGSRHLKNVVSELTERQISFSIDALRHGSPKLNGDIAEHINSIYSGITEITKEYDAVFITNPSFLHYETLKLAVPFSRAVFIEKPVFTKPDEDVSALKLKDSGIYYVACPLRRSPVISRLKIILGSQKVYSARAICSSYLPEWRKTKDYRDTYSAKSCMGGGVRTDLIHEMDYILNLFGIPVRVKSESGKFSALEIDSEDTASYILRYPDKVVSLHLDYTGRKPVRELELFCEQDTIVADIIKNEIRYLKDGQVEKLAPSDIHREEIIYFLDLIENKVQNINSIENALNTLKYALL